MGGGDHRHIKNVTPDTSERSERQVIRGQVAVHCWTHSGSMEWNDPVHEALCKMLSLATFHPLDRVAQLAEQRTFKEPGGFPPGSVAFRLGPVTSDPTDT